MGARLLRTTLDGVAARRRRRFPRRLCRHDTAADKDDGRVDWARGPRRYPNLIRGLHPWPHAVTFLAQQRFILHRSHISADAAGHPPGAIIEAAGDRLRVATGDGVIDVLDIQAEGKRPMRVREFLAGHPLPAGAIFHAPQ